MARDDDIVQELREQTKWLRLLAYTALKPMLQDALKNDKQKLVYEYSDGNKGVREVAKLAGVGAGTVGNWWALGLPWASALRHNNRQGGHSTWPRCPSSASSCPQPPKLQQPLAPTAASPRTR